jgi:hypothetical protein
VRHLENVNISSSCFNNLLRENGDWSPSRPGHLYIGESALSISSVGMDTLTFRYAFDCINPSVSLGGQA